MKASTAAFIQMKPWRVCCSAGFFRFLRFGGAPSQGFLINCHEPQDCSHSRVGIILAGTTYQGSKSYTGANPHLNTFLKETLSFDSRMTLLTQYVVAFSVCLAMTLALPTPEDGKFGKRADADYVRFGKRADADYVRFGKRADADYVRFGKRADSDYVRFGKRTSDDSDDSGSSQDLLRLLQVSTGCPNKF